VPFLRSKMNVIDEMNVWKVAEAEDEPGEEPVIDHLSLSSIAHQLHEKYQRALLTVQEATQYAKSLLEMIGYEQPDQMMVNAALSAWQTMFPMDKELTQGPEIHEEQAPASTPTESWGSGTVSAWSKMGDTYDAMMNKGYGMPGSLNAFNAADEWLQTAPGAQVPQEHQQDIHNDAHYYMGHGNHTWPQAYHDALQGNAGVNKYPADPIGLRDHIANQLPSPASTPAPGWPTLTPTPTPSSEYEAPQIQPPNPNPLSPVDHFGHIPGDEQLAGKVKNWEGNPNRGVNPSYTGVLNGRAVYVKPQGGYHDDDIAHERAAFAVAQAMGVPMPHTAARLMDIPGHIGQNMEWEEQEGEPDSSVDRFNVPTQIQHSVGGHTLSKETYNHTQALANNEQDNAQLRHIALFDNVIGNADRHLGNIVRGDDGHIYPIDHGGAFEFDPDHSQDRFELGGQTLTPEETEALQRAGNVDLTSMGVDPDRHDAMQMRIEKMLEEGRRLSRAPDAW